MFGTTLTIRISNPRLYGVAIEFHPWTIRDCARVSTSESEGITFWKSSLFKVYISDNTFMSRAVHPKLATCLDGATMPCMVFGGGFEFKK